MSAQRIQVPGLNGAAVLQAMQSKPGASQLILDQFIALLASTRVNATPVEAVEWALEVFTLSQVAILSGQLTAMVQQGMSNVQGEVQ